MIDFPNKLKSLRALRGWSQEELAKKIGSSRSAIGNYEQGTREPSFEDLEAIADAFNCSIAWLIEEDHVGPEDMLVMDVMKNENLRDRLVEYAKLLSMSFEMESKNISELEAELKKGGKQ